MDFVRPSVRPSRVDLELEATDRDAVFCIGSPQLPYPRVCIFIVGDSLFGARDRLKVASLCKFNGKVDSQASTLNFRNKKASGLKLGTEVRWSKVEIKLFNQPNRSTGSAPGPKNVPKPMVTSYVYVLHGSGGARVRTLFASSHCK